MAQKQRVVIFPDGHVGDSGLDALRAQLEGADVIIMTGDIVDDCSLLAKRGPITADEIAQAHRMIAELASHFPPVFLPFPLTPGYEDRLARYLT